MTETGFCEVDGGSVEKRMRIFKGKILMPFSILI